MAQKTKKKAAAKRYTKPQLRERLKKKITDGDKGGKAGQWSARKAQMLAAAYKQEGGGYSAPKTETQNHLDAWTDEQWSTSDGSKARTAKKTKRYLPKKAWEALSPAEERKTNVKKETASKTGQQYVANTDKAKVARKKAVKKTASKKTAKTKTKAQAGATKKTPARKKTPAKKAPRRKATRTTAKKKTARQ